DKRKKALSLEKEVLEAARGLKPPLLEIGAAGRLFLDGRLENVLPLEDAKRHQEAKLIQNGKVVVDAEKIGKRREAIVNNVFSQTPVGVIILGGSHDLMEHLPKDTQYIRIRVSSYPK